jgi:cysteine-S-conjugate beta-lyase
MFLSYTNRKSFLEVRIIKYNFDEIIDRNNTNSLNVDGFRKYMFPQNEDAIFPYKDDELIRMWVADMEFATPPDVINAIKHRLDKRILGYTQVFDPNYYDIFLSWTKRHYDWDFPKHTMVTSQGIIPALYELVAYICQPDEKVMIVTPSYAYFKHAVDYNKNELVTSYLSVKDGYYTLDFEDIDKKMRDEKVTLCIFCNPHNPTGRVWTQDELQKFGDICISNDVWVISDEVHCDLLRYGKIHTPLSKVFPDYNKIITCMAPSKTFNLAGLMLANIIIPNDQLMEKWQARHYAFENPLSIAGAKAAYQHGEKWLSELKTYLDINFDYLANHLATHLPKTVFRISEATYLAWIDISQYVSDKQDISLFFAQNAGVLLEGSNLFVNNANGYIRLNLACPKAILQQGLTRITKALLRD